MWMQNCVVEVCLKVWMLGFVCSVKVTWPYKGLSCPDQMGEITLKYYVGLWTQFCLVFVFK